MHDLIDMKLSKIHQHLRLSRAADQLSKYMQVMVIT